MSKIAKASMSAKADIRDLKREVKEVHKIVSNIRDMILNKWKVQDEAYGEYRWPYDMDGDLLPTVNHTALYPWHNDEPHEEEG
tara:strand:- start:211 stop:459 length:249 start_codon:yes stop_codon:yes gene_type:complete